jgi:hypothetical protein
VGEGALPPICGAIKLVSLAFLPIPASPGMTQAAMTCVREPGHPELDADSSLHLCGTFAWKVGPGDDARADQPVEQCRACREGVPNYLASCTCPADQPVHGESAGGGGA